MFFCSIPQKNHSLRIASAGAIFVTKYDGAINITIDSSPMTMFSASHILKGSDTGTKST